ncbi:MAG TPA: FAD-dependent oxidoreductase [Humisphaera sp.]
MPKHIVIIGGGVIGLCSAYYAAKAGHAVTVLDRNPPARDGCSFGNAGMIVPSHVVPLAAPGMVEYGLRMLGNPRSPFSVRPRLSRDLLSWGTKFCQAATADHVRRAAPVLRDLNLASRAAYLELRDELGDGFGLTTNGLVSLCKTEHALHEEAETAALANRLGVPAEVLSAAEVARLDPDVTTAVAGGVYFPKDCHLNPGAFMAAVQGHLTDAGGRVVFGADVTDLKLSDGAVRAATTSAGTFEADEYVIAGGSWSPALAGRLGLDLPMQAGKGYSLTVPNPRQRPRVCAILVEARVAVTPMGGAVRFGGTMEIAGLDESVSAERVRGIVESVPSYFPAFRPADFDGIAPWKGLRPCSPDGLPYIGRTSRAANVVIATGHAMMGLSLGPVTGKAVAEVIAGRRPPFDMGMLAPERFEG